ncbi:MAG: hypothetical protein ABJC26_02400 [Gemmatimonadaceae bacterium]
MHAWDNPSARLVASLKGNFWGGTRVMFYRVCDDIRLQTFSVDIGVRVRLDGIGEPTAVAPLNSVALPAVSNRFELWVPRRTSVMLSSRGGAFKVVHGAGELQNPNNSCAP